MGIIKEDVFLNETVNKISLNNQSGTVVALECYVKKTKMDTKPERVGRTGNFPVGQTEILDLDALSIEEESYVSAYVNVDLLLDRRGHIWAKYKKGIGKKAEYVFTGSSVGTEVALHKIV